MRFNVRDCAVYGVKRPLIIFVGWVDNSIEKIVIKIENETIFEKQLSKSFSKIKSFSLGAAVNVRRINYHFDFYAVDDRGFYHRIYSYKSTLFDRIIKKIKSLLYKNVTFIRRHFTDIDYKSTEAISEQKYNEWIKKHECFSPKIKYEYNPLISIVMPVYNVKGRYLRACIDSILRQSYENFEICIADDCSTAEDTINTLKEYQKKDKRIKVFFREQNGHISNATNSALNLATGEFVGLMDNDDELMPNALNEVVKVLNQDKTLDFIYSDEDKIDEYGNRSDPHFKPDYAKDTFYGGNYICHFSVIRRKVIEEIGRFRTGYEGAQDFDLFLRVLDRTDKIYHIDKILYHWRMIPGSTALDSSSKNYAGEAGKRALEDLLEKKGVKANVNVMVNTHYFIEYLLEKKVTIDLIIHSDGKNDLVIDRLVRMATEIEFDNYRIVIITDESDYYEFILSKYLTQERFVTIPSTNNINRDINRYARTSKADLLLLLKKECEILSFNALEVMAGYTIQDDVGVVGGKVVDERGFGLASGYYLQKGNLLGIPKPSYPGDYGTYGSLLTQYNYKIVESECYMVKTKDFIEIGGLDETVDYRVASYLICVQLYYRGLRNVVIPHIEIMFTAYNDITQEEMKVLSKRINSIGCNIERDKYYNVNFSSKHIYKLPG